MLINGENLDEDARIYASTIHGAKGGEEDNVILCLDLGRTINKSRRVYFVLQRFWFYFAKK